MSDSEIHRTLGRVETKVDDLSDTIKSAIVRLEAQDARIDARVGTIEKWQHKLMGFALAVGAALGIGGSHGLKL